MSGFSLARRAESFGHAARGLATMLRGQHNARIHAAVSLLVCIAALALGVSAADWKWLVLTMALVWAAEAMNTAFEHLCDVVSPEHSAAVKHAKDIAAGSVLICAIAAVVMAVLVFVPYF